MLRQPSRIAISRLLWNQPDVELHLFFRPQENRICVTTFSALVSPILETVQGDNHRYGCVGRNENSELRVRKPTPAHKVLRFEHPPKLNVGVQRSTSNGISHSTLQDSSLLSQSQSNACRAMLGRKRHDWKFRCKPCVKGKIQFWIILFWFCCPNGIFSEVQFRDYEFAVSSRRGVRGYSYMNSTHRPCVGRSARNQMSANVHDNADDLSFLRK